MKDLIILGSGGFAKEVLWLVERLNHVKNEWSVLGLLDDNESKWGSCLLGYKVLGGVDVIFDYPQAYVICAIGSAMTRRSVVAKVKKSYSNAFASLVDPSVLIGSSSQIGEGSIVCAGSFITVDVSIGNHVIINLDCTIGHDAFLDDFVTLYPSVNISGNVCLQECVEFGTGGQIIQGVSVGIETIVGAGAVVNRDLPAYCTAVGVPAKVIKQR